MPQFTNLEPQRGSSATSRRTVGGVLGVATLLSLVALLGTVSLPGAAATAEASRKEGLTEFSKDAATVTFPGFLLSSRGNGLVTINVSREVKFQQKTEGNTIRLVLQGARISASNNLSVLDTSRFGVGVQTVRLRATEKDVVVEIQLARPGTAEVELKRAPRGAVVLVAELLVPSGK